MSSSEFVSLVRGYADSGVFARGQDYFREDRVRVVYGDDGHFEGEVRGTRPYSCGWWFENGVAGAMCDCPYVSENEDLCKHLVALALAMESVGIGAPENVGEIIVMAFPGLSSPPQGKTKSIPQPSMTTPPRSLETNSGLDGEEPDDDFDFDFDSFDDEEEENDDDFDFDPFVVGYPDADDKKGDRDDESKVSPPVGRVLQLPNRSTPPGNEWWQEWVKTASHAANAKSDVGPQAHGFLIEIPGFDPAHRPNDVPRVQVARCVRKRKKDGSFGMPTRPTRRATFAPGPGYDAARPILRLLAGTTSAYLSYGYGDSYDSFDSSAANETFVLPPESAVELLSRICATGAAFLSLGFQAITDEPVEFDGGPPFQLKIEIDRADDDGAAVRASLDRGEESIAIDLGVRFAARGLALIDRRWIRFEPAEFAGALQKFAQREGVAKVGRKMPAHAVRPFLEAIHRLPSQPQLAVDPLYAPAESIASLEAILRVELEPTSSPREGSRGGPRGGSRAVAQDREATIHGSVVMKYGSREFLPGDVTKSWLDSKEWRIERRDIEKERALLAVLESLEVVTDMSRGVVAIPSARFAEVVRRATEAGFVVVAGDRRLVNSSGAKARVESSGVDWFDLSLDAGFGESSPPLPELLAAVSRGQRIVRLSDGAFGVLPEAWLNARRALLKVGETKGDAIRFHRAQAMLLHALAESAGDDVVVETDETFERARTALLRGDRPLAEDPPAAFKGSLRPYQRDGLGWMNHLMRVGMGGCLADDMGLGKTVQVLALIAGLVEAAREEKPARATKSSKSNPRSKPATKAPTKAPTKAATKEATKGATKGAIPRVLVVAPRSLVFNWIAEAERFVPGLPTLAYVGTDRESKLAEFEGGLVVTTYGTLRGDATLPQMRFSLVVLDEAQAIKNRDTATAIAARSLQCDQRLALSGTPVENHAGELISLFEFLVPGLLGAHAGARRREFEGDSSRDLLFAALRPLVLRRTKQQVAPDLPSRTEQTIYCDLEGAQRRRYDELRDHYRAHLLSRIEASGLKERDRFQVLEALLRLRQAACHPALIDARLSNESSAKLDVLLPRLSEVVAEGHKALVFSQFTSFLALVRARLDAAGMRYEYLDGKTRDRAAVVKNFQEDPNIGVFLISLRAGGLGLNLTVADYVFLLDPWWNPAVEAQAIDRTHRIGQERPVFAYRLLAKDTVEDHVAELQAKKRELFDSLMAETATLRNLDVEDLRRLLA